VGPRGGAGGVYSAASGRAGVAERDSGAGARLPQGKRRRGLIIGGVIAAVLIVLAAAGLLVTRYFTQSSSFAVGSCVKQTDSKATAANCSDANAFTVVTKVDKREDCPDLNQPFVVVERRGGKTEVLCLRPASQK
jgi:hypothetical protein